MSHEVLSDRLESMFKVTKKLTVMKRQANAFGGNIQKRMNFNTISILECGELFGAIPESKEETIN